MRLTLIKKAFVPLLEDTPFFRELPTESIKTIQDLDLADLDCHSISI